MTNYELSERDIAIAWNQNKRNGWGFSKSMLLYQLRRYKNAFQSGDLRIMAMIEYRLTDANFHYECGFLCRKDFDGFKQAVAKLA